MIIFPWMNELLMVLKINLEVSLKMVVLFADVKEMKIILLIHLALDFHLLDLKYFKHFYGNLQFVFIEVIHQAQNSE